MIARRIRSPPAKAARREARQPSGVLGWPPASSVESPPPSPRPPPAPHARAKWYNQLRPYESCRCEPSGEPRLPAPAPCQQLCGRTPGKKETEPMQHEIVSREEWLAARLGLLREEKELTRRSDELARRRQELPWVRVNKEYRFETDAGTRLAGTSSEVLCSSSSTTSCSGPITRQDVHPARYRRRVQWPGVSRYSRFMTLPVSPASSTPSAISRRCDNNPFRRAYRRGPWPGIPSRCHPRPRHGR